MVLTLGADDAPRRIVADAEGRITLRVRSGSLRVDDGPDAFTIYEEGELDCAGRAELRVASPGCTTVAELVRGALS
jgi:hypothetical protein